MPVVEHRAEVGRSLAALAAAIERHCDVPGLIEPGRLAPRADVLPLLSRLGPSGSARVAVAGGPAFSFAYPDNLERLEEAGAELVVFDPRATQSCRRASTPCTPAEGSPRSSLETLAANRPLLADVRRRVTNGLVTWAECGGLLWLAASLDGRPLAGVVPAAGHMTGRLTLGYRRARVLVPTPVGGPGTQLRGHEFHYSVLDPAGDALDLEGRFGAGRAGFATPTLLASYLHLHLGADPAPAERLVAAASQVRTRSPAPDAAARLGPPRPG